MMQYNKLKKKYDSLVKQTLEKNKRILLESFVEYYGEKSRYTIEKRFNEIIFVYYIDWDMIDLVVKDFIPQVDNQDKYVDFINFSNSRKNSFFSKFIKSLSKQSNLPDNLIGMTNNSIVNDEYFVKWLSKACSRSVPCSYNYGSINNMHRLISFQILALNERAIIHEINHALTRDNIAYIMDENTPIGSISKTGLSIDILHQNNGERIVEELLNEKASVEIEKIFKAKGGDLSAFCLNIPLEYAYEDNFYLVDNFYDLFKEYIKMARIGDNKNALVERVGKKEYNDFIKLVNGGYSEDITQIDSYKREKSSELKNLIEQMRKNGDSSQEMDPSTYLEQLQNMGYDLRIMNNISQTEQDNLGAENEKESKKNRK